jgi:hypothetical protein
MTRRIAPLLLLSLGGCDYTGDFLFAEVTPVDDIWILTAEDGGFLVPADIGSVEDIAANTIYAEVGAPQTTANGGITADFVGTGGPVCIWLDPEVVYWNQAVAERLDEDDRRWSFPDNIYDDGDIELFAGLSVYYTGSPGETIGDFVVAYEDSLGNEVPISLAACPNTVGLFGDPAAGGRGSPEFCTIQATDPGIGYTILLQTFSTPRDDSRLSFGLLLANGSCNDLRDLVGSSTEVGDECLIQGEAIMPTADQIETYYSFDELNESGRIWSGSIDFEAAFCDPEGRLDQFCEQELLDKEAEGELCEIRNSPDENNRCYCGDLNDTPAGGAL